MMAMYDAMREHFGHRNWWPGDGPMEICIGAILTQNTNWGNVKRALANLKSADCLSIHVLHACQQGELAEMLRPAGYYNVKAKRLKNFIAHVHETCGDDIEKFLNRPVEDLRAELLSINGIGRETADSMILYAAGKASFVVDAYTARIFLRHGLTSVDDDYESIKELCESTLDEDVELWNDFHAQLVAVGANHCKPKPTCAGCPLEPFAHDIHAGQDDW